MSSDVATTPLRVSGEDDPLLRQCVVPVLTDGRLTVAPEPASAVDLRSDPLVARRDVAAIDIRMPPHRDDDGLRVAVELREPVTAVFRGLSIPSEGDEHRLVQAVFGNLNVQRA